MSEDRANVIILCVCTVIVVAIFAFIADRSSRCEDKGGVYLFREGKCVKGIERVEL